MNKGVDMKVKWEDIAKYYGWDINEHKHELTTALNTTHAKIACNWIDRFPKAYSSGEHAEAKLLNEEFWQKTVPSAMQASIGSGMQALVTLIINRSPCSSCCGKLVDALDTLKRKHPFVAEENSFFLLAMRGKYKSTTDQDFASLVDAGWSLGTLEVNVEKYTDPKSKEGLSSAGIALQTALTERKVFVDGHPQRIQNISGSYWALGH
tara:strand:+ start:23892 stop:24515 length:624 start_codon:yes stop_codon:yes gene_type:complete